MALVERLVIAAMGAEGDKQKCRGIQALRTTCSMFSFFFNFAVIKLLFFFFFERWQSNRILQVNSSLLNPDGVSEEFLCCV